MPTIQYTNREAGAPVGPHRRILTQAARDALAAPSILNSQPWRWQVSDDTADLRADRARQLVNVDPDGRMLTVSCGAALHHARTALTAAGVIPEITYLPDPDDADLLARVGIGGTVAPSPAALRRYRAMAIRRTDRRPFAETPVPGDALDDLSATAHRYGAHLHLPTPEAMVGLTVAAGHAATVEQADPGYLAELATWVHADGPRPDDDWNGTDGVPADTAAAPAARPVPIRDFTATGIDRRTIHDPVALADRYARYAILYTDGDGPRDWLAAGEALSAVLLEAAARGLATSPMSDLIEVVRSRLLLRDLLSGIGYPQMVVRIGVPDAAGRSASTPRRSPDGVIEEQP
jgi:nitroreductase